MPTIEDLSAAETLRVLGALDSETRIEILHYIWDMRNVPFTDLKSEFPEKPIEELAFETGILHAAGLIEQAGSAETCQQGAPVTVYCLTTLGKDVVDWLHIVAIDRGL